MLSIISTPDHWHARNAIDAALAERTSILQKPDFIDNKGGTHSLVT